ncbi:MAG: hypothetical protein QM504_10230 [Pseudomonadota bacterium]
MYKGVREITECVVDLTHLELSISSECVAKLKNISSMVKANGFNYISIAHNEYKLLDDGKESSFREQGVYLNVFDGFIHPVVVNKHSGEEFEAQGISISDIEPK